MEVGVRYCHNIYETVIFQGVSRTYATRTFLAGRDLLKLVMQYENGRAIPPQREKALTSYHPRPRPYKTTFWTTLWSHFEVITATFA